MVLLSSLTTATTKPPTYELTMHRSHFVLIVLLASMVGCSKEPRKPAWRPPSGDYQGSGSRSAPATDEGDGSGSRPESAADNAQESKEERTSDEPAERLTEGGASNADDAAEKPNQP